MEHEQQAAKQLLKATRFGFWVSIGLGITLGILLLIGIWYMYSRKKRLQTKYLALADEFECVQNNFNRIDATLKEKNNRSEEVANLLHVIMATENKLAITMFERSGSVNAQARICAEAKKIVKNYVHDDERKKAAEKLLDLCYDNIMEKIRREMPALKEPEIELLVLIYMHFSPSAIAEFCETSLTSIYTKKCRLKTKIEESDAPSKAKFIEMMRQ